MMKMESMDALTNAALDNLFRNALPRLQKALADIHKTPAAERQSNPELLAMLRENNELIKLLLSWAGETDETFQNTTQEDSALDIEPSSADTEMPADMSDEEARMMLAAMDTSAVSTAESLPASSAPPADISEDEALMLLAEMDAPAAPEEPASQDPSVISDDEATRLLAEMDGSPPPSPALDDGPIIMSGDDSSASGAELSDDDAMRLLAAMDAPIAQPAAKASHTATKPATASADDEAMAMLAAMGGLDDSQATTPSPSSPPPPAPASTAQKSPAQASQSSASGELDTTGIDEIPEWENNDFASDPEMMNDFTQNTGEIMQALDDTVLRLEQNPTDKPTIEEIFRAAHTLKGAAGMFGFKAIERVMHRMENLFDLVRKGKLVPNSDTIDVVFQGLDVLKKLLAAVLAGKPSGIKTAPMVRMLELAAEGKPTGIKKSASMQSALEAPSSSSVDNHGGNAAPPQSAGNSSSGSGGGHAGDDHGGGGQKKKSEAASTIRVDLERLDALVNLVGELVIDRTRFINIEESLRVQAPQLKLASNMTETLQQFGRHMNEIQEIIMKVRMVPVGSVFNKYPRIVRDLARQLGKQIDLVIEGEETELDKTLVEQIADPLVHLIRNACDHGVEMPQDRQASGKKPNGTVTLSAKQEGNYILIQITDDGKGMDINRIKSKAIEKGLITADQPMTDKDIFNLIFEPGFSTAEKVTTVSGRGVGMDVVKKQIAKLKGLVDISSTYGKGSIITIQLPLTLAIMQSLLVNASEEVFAIPLNSVVESIRIKPNEIQRVGETQVIKVRNTVLPLMYLDEILGLKKKDNDYWYRHSDSQHVKAVAAKRRSRRAERLFVVVVGSAEKRFGLVVDSLLNQQEMVIKPMGSLLRGTPCVAGGAVMGNGEVVLVLDIPEVESFYKSRVRQAIGEAS
jgi:two-component system chemotaxis sensor kinase CheA